MCMYVCVLLIHANYMVSCDALSDSPGIFNFLYHTHVYHDIMYIFLIKYNENEVILSCTVEHCACVQALHISMS